MLVLKNVLIQIGIPVISVDGLLIKKARSYVLKCISCYKYVFDYDFFVVDKILFYFKE